jgi:hypothetical protein
MNDGLLISPARSIEPAPRDRVTALASAMQRRPIVIVMGAPGSGAALCAHVLSALGVDMASANAGTAAGAWERAELAALHDRILGLFNRAHLGPFHEFPLPVAWWADPRVAVIKREIVEFLECGMGASCFGFKDPRAVRLLPVWQQLCSELKLTPKFVLCLRSPAQIAAILSAGDGLDPAAAEYRWFAHTLDFFRYAKSFDICTVEYESWFEDPSTNVTKLKEFLGLEWEHNEDELDLAISGIVGAAAQAEEPGRREPHQPLVRSLYKLARHAGEDRRARDQITSLASQFVAFQQLQRPLQQAFEDVSKVVAGLPEIEQEVAALRAAAGEHDALIAAQRAQLDDDLARKHEARIAIEAEANGLRAELAEREARLAELSRYADKLSADVQSAQAERTARQEALYAEAEALRAEAEALREALARAEQEAEQRAAAAEALRAEAEGLREALARAEQEVEQRLTVADAMRGEIAALQEALAQTEHAGKEHSAAAEAAQAEIGTLRALVASTERQVRERAATAAASEAEAEKLRDRLVRAQDEAAQRGAAAASLRDEIAELQSTLTAARQAGQAALAAFRIDMAAKPKPDRPRGWRRAIMRLSGALASF